MSNQFPATGAFAPQISFWCQIWQAQLEQSFRLWGYWAQFLPGESAAQLSAEAEALKPVVRTAPARPTVVKAAPKAADAAAKPAAKVATKPVLAVATDAPAPKTTPAKKAPRTPVEAKAKPAAAKPTMH